MSSGSSPRPESDRDVLVVEALPHEALSCRGNGLTEDLAHEVVAEAEPEPVDAENPTFAEALELLRELGRVGGEHLCEPLGIERLVEHGGGGEDPERLRPLGPALVEEGLCRRPRSA